jgi:hypothetical protein
MGADPIARPRRSRPALPTRPRGTHRPWCPACTRLRWTPPPTTALAPSVHATPVDAAYDHGGRACTRLRWTPPTTTAVVRARDSGGRRLRPRRSCVHATPVDAAYDHGARACTRLRWTPPGRGHAGGMRLHAAACGCMRLHDAVMPAACCRLHASRIRLHISACTILVHAWSASTRLVHARGRSATQASTRIVYVAAASTRITHAAARPVPAAPPSTRLRRTPPTRVHGTPAAQPSLASTRIWRTPATRAYGTRRRRGARAPDHGARACTRLRWTPPRPRRSCVHATPVDAAPRPTALARARDSRGRRPDHGARACTRIRWTPPRPRHSHPACTRLRWTPRRLGRAAPTVHGARVPGCTRIRWTPPPRPRRSRVHANPVDAAPPTTAFARARESGRRPDYGVRASTRLRWTTTAQAIWWTPPQPRRSCVHANPVDAAPIMALACARESGGRRSDHGARACTRLRMPPPTLARARDSGGSAWTPLARARESVDAAPTTALACARESGGRRPDHGARVYATPVDGARACTRIRWTPPTPSTHPRPRRSGTATKFQISAHHEALRTSDTQEHRPCTRKKFDNVGRVQHPRAQKNLTTWAVFSIRAHRKI